MVVWVVFKGGMVDGESRGGRGVGKGKGVPSIMSHSGFLTRSESGCGSRSVSHFVSSASLISSSVRWRMKTGLPRHLMITLGFQQVSYPIAFCRRV